MQKIDVVFQIIDWLEAGVSFNTESVSKFCSCSRATSQRAIKYLKNKRHLDLKYDRIKKTFVLGEISHLSKAELDRRTYENNREKILFKKKLKNIFGDEWRKHYLEGEEKCERP